MGWREFVAWLEVVKRQQEATRPDPGSWANTENDPQWIQMRAERDALRG